MRIVILSICVATALAKSQPPAPQLQRHSAGLAQGVDRSSAHTRGPRSLPRKDAAPILSAATASPTPSFYWAVLHNWLYFLSLGFNAVNVQFLVRSIVDGPAALRASPKAIALSGKVESVDKLLTFLGIGFLCALSDVRGRVPLMAWSSLGFALTNLIQAQTKSSVSMLYLADLIDGCTSCMTPVCQAYVVDCSPPEKRAVNLGIFQGLSIGAAFVLAFPIGGVLGAKYGPRIPLLIAAGLQLVNALIVIFLTPESRPVPSRAGHKLDLKQANPIGVLRKLFGGSPLLRDAAVVFALISLARNALDAQFITYSSLRFGWTQQQSGPVMVIVGLMIGIAPRILVPLLGLKQAILLGTLIFAAGLVATGLAPTPASFVGSILIVSIGCVCIPAVQGFLANLASPVERGALLGGLGSLSELTGAIGSTMYAGVLAAFNSEHPPLPNLAGAHFLLGSLLLLIAWVVATNAFATHGAAASRAVESTEGLTVDVSS